MGTPEAGAAVLEKLITSGTYAPQLVITQPDKPIGRKQELTPPPVKALAQKHGMEVWQPATLKNPQVIARIREKEPTLIIIAAYGRIIPKEILAIPPRGTLNVHPSLLPLHRGSSPVQYAILEGDAETGATVMLTDEGMDTGPILAQTHVPISPNDTAQTLSHKLFEIGAELLLETLPKWLQGTLKPRPQDHTRATTTKLLAKEDGEIKPEYAAERIERMLRALQPWPGIYLQLTTNNSQQTTREKMLKILKARVTPCEKNQSPLTLSLTSKKELCLHTEKDCLILETVHPEGKKPMSGYELWLGYRP